jgi:hypothetical protein
MKLPPPIPPASTQITAARYEPASPIPPIAAPTSTIAPVRIALRPNRSEAVPATSEAIPQVTDIAAIRFATAIRSVFRS